MTQFHFGLKPDFSFFFPKILSSHSKAQNWSQNFSWRKVGTLTYFLKELIFSLVLLSHGDTCWYHKVRLCNGDIMKTRSLATIHRVLLSLLVLPKRMAVIQVDTSNEI